MHWSDRFVGEPYVPDIGDCAALAERVAHEVFGKTIGLRDSYARRIDRPADGCPALFIGRGRLCHIGVMCWIADQWWVLHVDVSAGFVIRQRLSDVTRVHFKFENFYEWI